MGLKIIYLIKFMEKKDSDNLLEDLTIPKKFIIKVTIIECRQLLIEESLKEIPNGYVIVKIFNQERISEVKTEQVGPKFEETYDFHIVTTRNEFKAMKVIITVWHKRKFYQRDILIGSHTIDVWNVYNKSTKMMNKAWGVLSHKEVPNPGFINYSIMVGSEGDRAVALSVDMEDDEVPVDDEEHKVRYGFKDLIQGAPPLEMKSFEMSICIYKGEFCSKLPGITHLNSMFRIVHENENYESNIVSKSFTPKWNLQWNIPMRHPFYLTYIVVDIVNDNSIIGKIFLDFVHLVKDGNLEPKWYLIYGPIRDEDSFIKNIKYQYRIGKDVEPYFYYGRVLASAKWVEDDTPTKAKYDITDAIPPNEINYIFWVDIYELSISHSDIGESIFFEVQMGEYLNEKEAKYNNSIKKYYLPDKEKRFHSQIISLPKDVGQMPDCFIRIYRAKSSYFGGNHSKEYIGYKRIRAVDLLLNKWNIRVNWEKMRMCETTIKGDSAENYLGFLLCSINLFPKIEDDTHKRPLLFQTTNFKKYKFISVIYMANSIPVASSSLPKPKVDIIFNGKRKSTTRLKEGTINPIWGESLYLSTLINDSLELSEHIRMEVYDESPILKNIYIGQAEIPIVSIKKYNHQTYIDNEIFQLAKWYDLYHGTHKLKTRVLAAFFIVKLIRQVPENIKISDKIIWPKIGKYRMFIFIVGVRQIPEFIDLRKGYVIAKYYVELEGKTAEKEKFLYQDHKYYEMDFKYGIYDNNFNNYDSMCDPGKDYKLINIQEDPNFVFPLELLVFNNTDKLALSATIDISK